jgi:hypothetical protein
MLSHLSIIGECMMCGKSAERDAKRSGDFLTFCAVRAGCAE